MNFVVKFTQTNPPMHTNRSNRMRTLRAALIALALLAALSTVPALRAADANPPGKMTFQGFLTDASSPPVPLGNVSPVNKEVIFRIYDNAAEGTVKWAESQIVTVDKGHFSVLLGEGSSVSGDPHATDLSGVFVGADASDRWLGITVDGAEITPRIQFFAAPYAQLARVANSAISLSSSSGANLVTTSGSNVGIGTTSPSTMLQIGEGVNAGTGGLKINTGWMNPVFPEEARPLDVQVRGESKLVVNTQGHVGIGTSTPVTTLDVRAANAAITVGTAGNTEGALFFGNSSHGVRRGFPAAGNNNVGLYTTGGDVYLSGNGPSTGHFVVKNNGYVGMRTATPEAPLEVRHSGSETYGIGILLRAPNLNDGARMEFDRAGVKAWGIGIHAGVGNGSFGIFEDNHVTGGHGTPRLTIQPGGNIRIEGQNTLEFGGGLGKEANNGKIGYQTFSSGLDIVGAGPDANSRRVTFHSQNTFFNGNVGVGIINPAAPLHVRKRDYNVPSASRVGGRNDGYGVYLGNNGAVSTVNDYNNTAGDNETIAYGALSAVFEGDVIASSHIWVGNALAYSDARAKKLLGSSDSGRDLSLLRDLKIRDFTWIDKTVDNHRPQKKLLAQEVEAIFPQAVERAPQPTAIPSVYQLAKSIQHNAEEKKLLVSLGKAHDFKVGDRVDLFTEDAPMKNVEVTAVPSEHEFTVACDKTPKSIFVYGKYVNDFRAVDYDAIAMLNVSATQELARQVEALKASEARIAELEEKTSRLALLEAKAARVDSLELQLAELKKLVAGLVKESADSSPRDLAAVAGR